MTLVIKQRPPMSTPLIPTAEYVAEVSSVGEYENAFEHRLAFKFTITEGDYAGMMIERRTAVSLTPKSKLGETVAALFGRELTDNDLLSGVDLDQLVGTHCRVSVVHRRDRSGTPYNDIDYVTVHPNPSLNGQQSQTGRHADNVIDLQYQ